MPPHQRKALPGTCYIEGDIDFIFVERHTSAPLKAVPCFPKCTDNQ